MDTILDMVSEADLPFCEVIFNLFHLMARWQGTKNFQGTPHSLDNWEGALPVRGSYPPTNKWLYPKLLWHTCRAFAEHHGKLVYTNFDMEQIWGKKGGTEFWASHLIYRKDDLNLPP